MSVTSGPSFAASLRSAALQLSLESRLRALLDVNGSPEYGLIWKQWAIGSGPPICALRASRRRTSANVSTGWPTPQAGSPATEKYNEAGNTDFSRKTVALVTGHVAPSELKKYNLTGWPTTKAEDGNRRGGQQKRMLGRRRKLVDAAACAQAARSVIR